MKPNENPAKLEIDVAKTYQWKLAKEEICHIKNLSTKFNLQRNDDFPFKELIMHCIGPESEGAFLRKEIGV